MSSKSNFNDVDSRPNYYAISESILEFWERETIFAKSIELRDKNNAYVFYDGPPFVTGLPHYGSLLPSIAKDLIPRYQTMKGKRVERVWGWDCHGLPIENKVEQELKIKNRRDIERIGLDKFIPACLNYVSDTTAAWKWYVDRIGRWVDMKHAYRTMDLTYMESVMWAFKQMYDKKMVYQGKRVSLYCPRCGSPISNFEVAMDNSYKDLTENSTTYKFKIKRLDAKKLLTSISVLAETATKSILAQEDIINSLYILAWSTTPWNKLVTMALAINPKFDYLLVRQNNEYFILAETTKKMLKKEAYEVLAKFNGKQLIGLQYEPLYDYFAIPDDKKAYLIIGGDFVTDDEGTGVVTLAVYGEEDFKVMSEQNIAMIEHIDDEGLITIDRAPWKGTYYLDANKIVDDDLQKRGLLYEHRQHTHSVAVCWRCATRLYYAPQDAWFVKVSQLKPQLFSSNEEINWFPKHFKNGRFKKGIESAPDWCISRRRYWATPMPVWKCNQCGELKALGSIAEIEELSGKKVTDLHRPYIDAFTFPCEKCHGTMSRIEEVLDCWLDSGSMPYAQFHYPFENKTKFEVNFPGDYIIEYVAQTRAWFYVMHVLSNAVFGTHAFKNVVVTGVIKGTDGRKMSKSYGNYPDPKKVIETYGGDALRLYLMGSSVMAGGNLNIDEKDIKEQSQRVLNILWNSYKYLITYAKINDFIAPKSIDELNKLRIELIKTTSNPLDKWMLIRINEFITNSEKALDNYNMPKAIREIRPFIDDISTWYIRRNRDRFVNGDNVALQVLYITLFYACLVMAPTIPFMTEEIYQNLTIGGNFAQSIHLSDWPLKLKNTKQDRQLLADMILIREICSLGNAQRKLLNIPVRQPLSKISVNRSLKNILDPKYATSLLSIIMDELNIKDIEFKENSQESLSVEFDTNITPQLKAEGEVRKLVREIMEARKKAGTKLTDLITITLLSWPKEWEQEIKKKALVKEIKKGEKLEILS